MENIDKESAGLSTQDIQLLMDNLEQTADIIASKIVDKYGDYKLTNRDKTLMNIYGYLRTAVDRLIGLYNAQIMVHN